MAEVGVGESHSTSVNVEEDAGDGGGVTVGSRRVLSWGIETSELPAASIPSHLEKAPFPLLGKGEAALSLLRIMMSSPSHFHQWMGAWLVGSPQADVPLSVWIFFVGFGFECFNIASSSTERSTGWGQKQEEVREMVGLTFTLGVWWDPHA